MNNSLFKGGKPILSDEEIVKLLIHYGELLIRNKQKCIYTNIIKLHKIQGNTLRLQRLFNGLVRDKILPDHSMKYNINRKYGKLREVKKSRRVNNKPIMD
jgi:hypothetical protein